MGVGRPEVGTSGVTVPGAAGGRTSRRRNGRTAGTNAPPDLLPLDTAGPSNRAGLWERVRDEAWPWLIVGSMIAVQIATLAQVDPRVRGPLVLWFCLLCTGMSWARLLRLAVLPEMVTAVALSVAISGLVSALFLYTGHWSPGGTMFVLQLTTLMGVLLNNRMGSSGGVR